MENVALEATDRFFDLLVAQVQLDIAQKNQSSNDTLFRIAQGRFSLGKIAENDLLQLELSLMRANQEVAQATLDVQAGQQALINYLGLTQAGAVVAAAPVEVPDFEVMPDVALREAQSNRSSLLNFERRQLEAERDVAEARASTSLDASVLATFGLTQQARTVPELYVNPQDQQRVRVQFNVPILDWGRQRAIIRQATANQEVVAAELTQDQQNFEQEVFLIVQRMRISRQQLDIAAKGDEIGQKRFAIARNRFVIGKIDITDLNIAQQEKDQARRTYVTTLREFWLNFYNLRRLTLYDFTTNDKIRYAANE